MTANQEVLTFALKMYGEAMITYATNKDEDTEARDFAHTNMCFWQDQAWMLAKEIAEGKEG